jgi:aminopeptidase N
MRASIDKPLEFWLAELRDGPTAIARARAARALGEATAVGAVPALREALLGDRFWAVQAQAAGALGEIRGPAALEALGEGLTVKHPKARRAVVRALGQFRLPRAAELLRTPAASDASYFVEGEALKALGRTRQTGTRGELIAALPRESFGSVIRALALEGLAESADAAALPAVLDRLRYGEPVQARVAAVRALGKLGEGKRDPLDRLIQLLEDPDFYVRLAACEALAELGKRETNGPLERLLRADPSGRVQRAAREAIARIAAGKGEPGNLASVRSEVGALRDDVAALRAELSELRAEKGSAAKPRSRRPPA